MNRHCVSHTLSRISNQLTPISINHLCIARLRGIGDVLGERDAEDIRPLLHLLGKIGVAESAVCCAVEAIKDIRIGYCKE